MDLTDIASIAGKGGLFKIMKPTKNGVIVESLDKQKKKMVVGASHRVSALKDVSIYTTDSEGSVSVGEVLQKIHDEFGNDPGLDGKSDADEYRAFLKHVLPEHDENRVYPSDIKKLITWYRILMREIPEVFSKEEENATDTEQQDNTDEQSQG
jgi:hypothetical protein